LIFIRPLRSFIPAEKLRYTRITILKITHLPIVGAIWLFETAYQQVKGDSSTFSSIAPGATLATPAIRRKPKPFLSNRSKTSSQYFPDVSIEDSAVSPGKGTKEIERTVIVRDTDLESQVKDLSVKIAELTALIMAQQGTANEE